MSEKFKHLVFDLDDTLLDTHRLLIPRASREACEAMVQAGLNTDLESCLSAYGEKISKTPRQDVFKLLASKFGVKDGIQEIHVAQVGYTSFYSRKVETDISLFAGSIELLQDLSRNYRLHLVTSGSRRTQQEKIRILNLEALFESIHIVDPLAGETKKQAFEKIMHSGQAKPGEHLSIGNRIDTDIGEARALGWKACWVKYGEYVHMKPANDFEKPDFEINQILELKTVCHL